MSIAEDIHTYVRKDDARLYGMFVENQFPKCGYTSRIQPQAFDYGFDKYIPVIGVFQQHQEGNR